MRVAIGCVLVLVLAGCGSANAGRSNDPNPPSIPSYTPGPSTPGAVFSFSAQDGAHPVKSRSGQWSTPDNEISVAEHENVVKIDAETDRGFDWIALELRAPGGVPLAEGSYPDARNRERFPDGPGMQVVSNGLGCGDEFGEFVIDRIERSDGRLTGLDAGWVQSCGAVDKPVFTGRVHFQAQS